MDDDRAPRRGRISRRALLAGAPAAGIAAGIGGLALARTRGSSTPPATAGAATVPFHGEHQAGIATPPQAHLQLAAFDLTTARREDVIALLRAWSLAAARMCAGDGAADPLDPAVAPADSGEALGLPPARLTLTFGFGAGLFARDGADRYGLTAARPAPLVDLPPFATDDLEPARGGGDLCVQACADDPQVAFHGVRNLARSAGTTAMLRWSQAGFLAARAGDEPLTPRNLLGFKDGTNNIDATDPAAMRDAVWAGDESPAWMRGGSYLVARRIRLRIEQWDRDPLADQEARIGRRKASGAPLTGAAEHDAPDLDAVTDGAPVIPSDAHIRLAGMSANAGARILRRSYSFADGVDALGRLDAGLMFLCYQRDPRFGFIPVQERLAAHDALNHYISHTGSAVFACPPGAADGGWVGSTLFGA